jgi:hypothetical protein
MILITLRILFNHFKIFVKLRILLNFKIIIRQFIEIYFNFFDFLILICLLDILFLFYLKNFI